MVNIANLEWFSSTRVVVKLVNNGIAKPVLYEAFDAHKAVFEIDRQETRGMRISNLQKNHCIEFEEILYHVRDIKSNRQFTCEFCHSSKVDIFGSI